jgi:inner membrane protein involved in colicin E2 resistance
MKPNIKESVTLKILGIIEAVLVLLTVVLYLITRDSSDFSGFAVAYSGIAAILVFLTMIVIFVFTSNKGWPARLVRLFVAVITLGIIFYLLPGNH